MEPDKVTPPGARLEAGLRGVPGIDLSGDAPPFIPDAPMNLPRFLRIAEEMARLVAAVHERGITHRDIRPDNFRTRDGELVLTGFRHAVTFDAESAGFVPLDRLPSDVSFIAPEQTGRMNRPVDYRADIYALGGTLYALATGRTPFPGTDRSALISAHLATGPRPPDSLVPWMPPVVSRIVLRLLAKEPDDRYQSASGLADDLGQLREAESRKQPLDSVSLRAADRVLLPRPPRRRHGRENALGELMSAFEAVARGGRQCLFITGEAGVGKTSLVNELQRPVAIRAGRFVRGKCEQFQPHRPLLAALQALRQLLSLLLGDNEENIRTLRSRLQAGLGSDSGVLHELLPGFAALAGDSAPPARLDPREAQIRLTGMLVRLIRIVASPTHPLVLVLDDLQWADRPTLDFVSALMEEEDLDGFLFVGLLRSEDAVTTPSLRRLVETPVSGVRASNILPLDNLPRRALDALVGEMLGARTEEIRGLAAEIHRTTQGNPFHAIELVQTLHRENILVFNMPKGRWTWDAAALANRPPSANVVEFLVRNLSGLPPETADALVAAACLGADMTLGLLAQATGTTAAETAAAVLPSLERGVLVTADAEEFSKGVQTARIAFCHDRMQQAAVSLRDDAWRIRLRLDMARRLTRVADDPAARLRGAEHYAEAVTLLEDPDEKKEVAELFLAAGRIVREAGAFAAARRFLRLALELLGPVPRENAPELTWQLREELHLVCYCLPDYAEADTLYAELCAHSPEAERLAGPASIQVMSLSNRTRYEEALRLGAALLSKLEIAVPLENPAEPFRAELEELYRALDAGALQRLATGNGGRGSDHAAAKLLNRMVPAAFFCRPEVADWLVVHAARTWISGHYDDAHIYPMACLALATIPARDDYASGYRAARAALSAGESGERGVETARARHVFGLFNCHWFEPLEHGLAQAHEAQDALLRSGELEFACYTFFTSQAALLETGNNLEELETENRRALAFAGKTGNRHALESYAAFRHLLDVLTAPESAEVEDVPRSNPMAACFHHMTRAMAACFFGDDEALARHTAEAARLSPYITGFYPVALVNVLESLSLVARRRAGNPEPGLAERLAANQDWLAARAADAPSNFAHLHDLVEAERLTADGRGIEALPVYERAIRRAKAHHRPWHAALATEKAARCYLALDLEQAGHRLIEQARTIYADWGATRKCAALEEEFPFLKAVAPGFREMRPVLAAMQQLASLRSMPQLAAATAEILHNLSGATDVQIIALDEDDQWLLKAGFSGAEPLPRQALGEAEKNVLVPSTLIRLGLRLLQPVLSDDAVLDTRFAGDPRFRSLERCSVLGVPVVSQDRAVAFVVLENRRLRGAFTNDMADMVGMLCGQLAVSIENARLYRSLEEKVELRTRELRAAEQTLAQTAYELTENIPVGTYVLEFDAQGTPRFTFLSERWLRMLNLSREEVLADHSLAVRAVHPDEREDFDRLNACAFAAKERFYWEGRIVVRGETRWVTIESIPRDHPGGGTVWEGVMTDITARKQAEQKIAGSEARLRRILDNIPVPMVINDPEKDGRITFLNTTFVDAFGYTLDDIPTVGHWADLAYPDPSYRRKAFKIWDAAVDRAMRTRGTIEPMEFRVRCKNGDFRDVFINAVALEDMLLVGFVDITERKRNEDREKRLEAQHRRDLENKLRTSLSASAIAHEINQPLSAILLQSKMAARQGSDPRKALEVITAEAQRVVTTIDKMKTLLRNVQTEHRQVDLAGIVNSALLYNKGMLARCGITIRTSGLRKPRLIMGDDAQLQLAITNILRNSAEAIEESRAKRREISIRLVQRLDSVELSIGDSGPGWSGVEQTETPLTTTKSGGTGIGLYVVRTAVQNHGGTITFTRSSLGGAKVRIVCPRAM